MKYNYMFAKNHFIDKKRKCTIVYTKKKIYLCTSNKEKRIN